MHKLLKLFSQEVTNGLRRRSITTCSKWAESCRIMPPIKGIQFAPSPWSFKYYPWLKEMHDCEAELIVGQKSAQMGFTEWALNTSLYSIDIKRTDVLYILPAKSPDAKDFSASRFDGALELSPHLSNLFSDVKNIGHKRAGSTNFYLRGSKSRSGLMSIPVGKVIIDEVDECKQENLPLAMQRLSGQMLKSRLMLSTPTIPGMGINAWFETSTQNHFFFKCPGCSRWTELDFPESLEIVGESLIDPRIKESFYKCSLCNKALLNETKCDWLSDNKWVPSNTQANAEGFYINQMYSPTITAPEFAESYFLSLTNPAEEQVFHNSKRGKAYSPKGASVTDEDLNNCIDNYRAGQTFPRGIITMGIDVGKYWHFHIDHWLLGEAIGEDINTTALCTLIHYGKTTELKDLDRFFALYKVDACVIDALPNTRESLQFANRFYGRVKICYYSEGPNGKEIREVDQHRIDVNRTAWMDLALGRYRNQMMRLPQDIDVEYRSQIKEPVRVMRKDKDGNYKARYLAAKDDHYAHARNYSEMALKFAASRSENRNIGRAV